LIQVVMTGYLPMHRILKLFPPPNFSSVNSQPPLP
jgi:hypothetical protein